MPSKYEFMELPRLEFTLGKDFFSKAKDASIDCTLLIFHTWNTFANHHHLPKSISKALEGWIQADPSIVTGKNVHLIVDGHGLDFLGGKIILAPIESLLRDYDDVRRYGEAVRRAIARARQLKTVRNLTVLIQPPPSNCMEESISQEFERFLEASALAAMAELYEQLEAREARPELAQSAIKQLEFVIVGDMDEASVTPAKLKEKAQAVNAIETGRRLARDIGGPHPERMTAIAAAETIQNYFAQRHPDIIKVEVIEDLSILQREYPLLMAVARASLSVSRHAPRVVKLEYQGPTAKGEECSKEEKEDLYLVGKGITYDTGGADLKVGGAMGGMSRDKCGAAAMAGFMATCALLQPHHLNVTTSLAFVRNSIGADAYVADEIIKSRAGIRVRIGNTDAEGRMVMADLLAEMRERALASGHPTRARLFTCATLTGHVARCYGPYGAALENGPARLLGIGKRLQMAGQQLGDPFELSTIRREDYDFVRASTNCEDVRQANRLPSSQTDRGHQYPFAFLDITAGLATGHGLDAPRDRRISFVHLDIAGAAEESGGFPNKPTGTPVAALTRAFILKN